MSLVVQAHKIHYYWHCLQPHLSCGDAGSLPWCSSGVLFTKPPGKIHSSHTPESAMAMGRPQPCLRVHTLLIPGLPQLCTSILLRCPGDTELKRYQRYKSAISTWDTTQISVHLLKSCGPWEWTQISAWPPLGVNLSAIVPFQSKPRRRLLWQTGLLCTHSQPQPVLNYSPSRLPPCSQLQSSLQVCPPKPKLHSAPSPSTCPQARCLGWGPHKSSVQVSPHSVCHKVAAALSSSH